MNNENDVLLIPCFILIGIVLIILIADSVYITELNDKLKVATNNCITIEDKIYCEETTEK